MKLNLKILIPFLLVLPVVVWLYNPLQLYFLNDDAVHVPASMHFNWKRSFSFRILSDVSLFLDSMIYGKNAWGYHLTNLVIHLLCTLVLYFLTRKIALVFRVEKEKQLAVLTSFIFLIYAFHSEAVLWIIGRGGSLAAFFVGLSLLFFMYKRKGIGYYILSLLFFVFGLFTYESVWVVPILVSFIAFFSSQKEHRKMQGTYVLGFWVLFCLFLVVRKVKEGTFFGTPYGITDSSIFLGIKTYAYNYAALFFRSFVPPSSTRMFVTSCILFLVAIFIVSIYLYRYRLVSPFRRFVYMSFLLSLVPYIFFGIDTHDSESERFLYLPSFFVSIIIADLILLIRQQKVRFAVIGAVTLFHLIFLYQTSAAFKKSSLIAQKTVAELQQNNGSYDHVYLADLPTQYKGAFIFRIDFSYILKWMVPDFKFKNLVTYSQREIESPGRFFHTRTVPLTDIGVQQIREDKQLDKTLKPGNDCLLYWTDSLFLVAY